MIRLLVEQEDPDKPDRLVERVLPFGDLRTSMTLGPWTFNERGEARRWAQFAQGLLLDHHPIALMYRDALGWTGFVSRPNALRTGDGPHWVRIDVFELPEDAMAALDFALARPAWSLSSTPESVVLPIVE